MKNSDWQIVYELYKTPNITKVANKLFITQPSLTKRLQRIEDIFQINIVNRTTKGVEFTPEGVCLAKKAEEYLKFMNDVKREIAALKDEETNHITIGASYTYSKYFLSEILFDYNALHSNVRFDILNEQSQFLFKKACEKDVDVAFVQGDYEGNVNQIKIDENKAYILTKEPCELNDILNMKRIEYKCNDKTKELLSGWWEEKFNQEMEQGMSIGYIDMAWQLVARGIGYTCCFLDRNFVNTYNLHLTPMLDENGEHLARNTWFVYKDDKKMSKSLKTFIKYIENEVAQ